MGFSMQDVIDRGRDPLNDRLKKRWDDPSLLRYAVDGLLTVRQIRPDLFIGQFDLDLTALQVGDDFPLPDPFAPAVADYVAGRAHLRDDEVASPGRADAFLKMALARLS